MFLSLVFIRSFGIVFSAPLRDFCEMQPIDIVFQVYRALGIFISLWKNLSSLFMLSDFDALVYLVFHSSLLFLPLLSYYSFATTIESSSKIFI